MKKLLLAIAVLFGLQTLAVADPLPGPSLWRNQRGSTLEVQWILPPVPLNNVPTSGFGGIFINEAKGFSCKGTPYGALGSTTPGSTSFEVEFLLCTTHTTWTGEVHGKKLYTHWTLVYTPLGGPPQTLKGDDVFTRVR